MNIQISKKEEILRAISDEPEFPGDIPEQLWDNLRTIVAHDNKAEFSDILRMIVRITKQNIKDRVKSVIAV